MQKSKTRSTLSRLLSSAAALAAAMTVLPQLSLSAAADTVTTYSLKLGGVQVTSANAADILGDGHFSYDASEKKLTLAGDYHGTEYVDFITNKIQNLTIYVASDSAIYPRNNGSYSSDGIYSNGYDFTVTGPGKLTILPNNNRYAINVRDTNVTFRDASLELGGYYAIEPSSYCSLNIINSTVHAVGDSSAISSFKEGITLTGCAVVTPTGGTVADGTIKDAAGTAAKEVLILPTEMQIGMKVAGTQVTVSNVNDILGNGVFSYDVLNKQLNICGSFSSTNNSNIIESTVNGLTVNTASNATIVSRSCFLYAPGYDVTLTGPGKLIVKADAQSYGFQTGDFTIRDTDLDIQCGNIYGSTASACSLSIINSNVHVKSNDMSCIGRYTNGIEFTGCGVTNEDVIVSDGYLRYESSNSNLKEVTIAVTSYLLEIAGTKVTVRNAADVLGDGKISYDAASNTLTLNGADINAGKEEAINSDIPDLTIRVTADSSLTSNGKHTLLLSADTTITGSGKLNVKQSDSNYDAVNAGGGSLTLRDANIKAVGVYLFRSASVSYDLTIINSDVEAVGTTNSAIYRFGACTLKNCVFTSPTDAVYMERAFYSYNGLVDANGDPVCSFRIEPAETFTITYKANGASGDDIVLTLLSGADTALKPADTFTRSGYFFTGWNTAEDGSGTNYDAGETVAWSTDVTLYAQWEQVVRYNLYIADKQVNNGNAADFFGDGTVSYDAASNTLTLNGANINCSYQCISNYIPDLTINVTADSCLCSTEQYGIVTHASGMTITGSGKLTVTSESNETGSNAGIMSDYHNLTIKNANVKVSGYYGYYEPGNYLLTLINSTFEATGTYAALFVCGALDMKGCMITTPAGGVFSDSESTVLDADGSKALTVRIEPAPAPEITTQPNGVRAEIGTTAQFTVAAVGADLSYQWQYNKGDGWKTSNGTGSKTDTLHIPVTAARNGWKYRCVITDINGSKTYSGAATLKVKTAITAQPASLSKPIGEQAKFTVTATGAGLTYQWQYSKGDGWKTSNGTGSKTNTLTINTAAGYNNYQYRCVITDANSAKTYSNAATLKVKTTITAQPNGVNAAIGETAKFTVAATGIGLKYQWQYNSGDGWKNSGASGATTATLSINAKTTYNGWKYRCIITDANGATATSSVATLKIRTAITAQPADISAVINEAAKFTVQATGLGLTYQWQYNSGDGWKNSGASGNKTAELTIYGKTTYNNWQFRCVITDANGKTTTSSVAKFTVKTKITAEPASVETASGTAAKFTVKASGLNLTYQWQYNSGSGWKNSGASGATTDTLTINAKATYNNWQYRCVITDGNGAKTYSDAAQLTVK